MFQAKRPSFNHVKALRLLDSNYWIIGKLHGLVGAKDANGSSILSRRENKIKIKFGTQFRIWTINQNRF